MVRPPTRPNSPVTVEGFQPFAMVPRWLTDHPEATDRAIRAWLALWDYADRNTNSTIVRRKRLAEAMNCHPSTADRALETLEQIGAIRVESRLGENGQTSNRYHLQWNPPTRNLHTPLITHDEGPLTTDDEGPSAPVMSLYQEPRDQEPHSDQERDSHDAPAAIQRFSDITTADSLTPLDGEPNVEIQEADDERRNPHWDALEYVFGYRPKGPEAGVWGRLARDVKAEGHDAAEIIARAERLIAQWGPAALTPTSLAKWWSRFGSPLGTASDEDMKDMRDRLDRARRDAELDAAAGPTIDVTPTSPEQRQLEMRDRILSAARELDDDDDPYGSTD